MHLGLRVPSIWFRASLERGGRRVTGVSLPGLPLIAAGSNGDVAWGFTNSYGDWQDLIVLELHPDDPGRYRTPDGWRDFELVAAPIEVAGGEPRAFTVRRTIWGPVVGAMHDGTPLALAWIAHDPRGYAPGFFELADTATVTDALDVAARSGIPPQNFVAADAAGHIAWTIIGQLPRRVGGGLASVSRRGPAWDGWLEPAEYPRIVDPSGGRLWTANARVVEGAMLAKIGDGGYDLGARAAQIRDRLFAIERATPDDMLRVQLDDEALFLARWRERLLERLGNTSDPVHAAARDAVERWGGRAAVSSQGYRIVRGWRLELIDAMAAALFAEVRAADPRWTYDSLRAEHWAWALVSERPLHLLDPRVGTWDELELAALDEFLEDELGVATPADLDERTWGERNTVRVRHPLSQAAPFLARWLDMPAVPLPGDSHMPRVQAPGFGASERFAVSPGDEANGYFHMPGGQSGHPRSPFFGAGHDDWVAGRPTPFLPGPTVRKLTLAPRLSEPPPVW
jgi:penicillin amidase